MLEKSGYFKGDFFGIPQGSAVNLDDIHSHQVAILFMEVRAEEVEDLPEGREGKMLCGREKSVLRETEINIPGEVVNTLSKTPEPLF